MKSDLDHYINYRKEPIKKVMFKFKIPIFEKKVSTRIASIAKEIYIKKNLKHKDELNILINRVLE